MIDFQSNEIGLSENRAPNSHGVSSQFLLKQQSGGKLHLQTDPNIRLLGTLHYIPLHLNYVRMEYPHSIYLRQIAGV